MLTNEGKENAIEFHSTLSLCFDEHGHMIIEIKFSELVISSVICDNCEFNCLYVDVTKRQDDHKSQKSLCTRSYCNSISTSEY